MTLDEFGAFLNMKVPQGGHKMQYVAALQKYGPQIYKGEDFSVYRSFRGFTVMESKGLFPSVKRKDYSEIEDSRGLMSFLVKMDCQITAIKKTR